jgi:hypothetical protein
MVAKKAGVSTTPYQRNGLTGFGYAETRIASAPLYARLERGHGAAMLVVAQSPIGEDGDESDNRGQPSSGHRALVARADFFVDERKQCGDDQSEREHDQENGIDDEDDVPRNTSARRTARKGALRSYW